MESKRNIDQLIEETLNSVSGMGTVKISPFFKDRVLTRMVQQSVEEEEGMAFLNWFTPKLQAAALVCSVFLNVVALISYSSDSYGENVENFAEVYGLSETDTNSYLYQN
ncbi:hypothetical protein [uncultured Maribacter sp.]|uniref:hypothetical protein n=1 Tax=uncultured Maribacter sp. TaxID=431308 RepID=UPI00260B434D|nr:hypothetical protein [uncultured Maribacter sp.]